MKKNGKVSIALRVSCPKIKCLETRSVECLVVTPDFLYSVLSGKRFSSIDIRMGGPCGTPRSMPAHDPAESGMGLVVCKGTYPAFMADRHQNSGRHSQFTFYLFAMMSSNHLIFLHISLFCIILLEATFASRVI